MTKKSAVNFLLSALCYIALGVALIAWPDASVNLFCYALGAMAAVYGLLRLFRYITHREERYAIINLLVGVVALALGICLFIKPELFASILPFVLGLYLIFDGIVKLQSTFAIKKEGYEKWGILLLLALVTVALGVVTVLNPFQSADFLITFIGICMLADGIINGYNAIAILKQLRLNKQVSAQVDAIVEAETAEGCEPPAPEAVDAVVAEAEEAIDAVIAEVADEDAAVKEMLVKVPAEEAPTEEAAPAEEVKE